MSQIKYVNVNVAEAFNGDGSEFYGGIRVVISSKVAGNYVLEI